LRLILRLRFKQTNAQLNHGITFGDLFERRVSIRRHIVLGRTASHARGKHDSRHFLVQGNKGSIRQVFNEIIALLRIVEIQAVRCGAVRGEPSNMERHIK
jgi:hypothetical protein